MILYVYGILYFKGEGLLDISKEEKYYDKILFMNNSISDEVEVYIILLVGYGVFILDL